MGYANQQPRLHINQQMRNTPGKSARPFKPGDTITAYDFFVLTMAVNFTSTANENQTGQTNNIGFPVQIFGATTDLSLNNLMSLKDPGNGGYNFSSGLSDTPFAAYVSRLGRTEQYKWWNLVHRLGQQNPLTGFFNNLNSDPAGTMAFFSVRDVDPFNPTYQPQKVKIVETSDQFQLSMSFNLTGVANQNVPAVTPYYDHPIIIISASMIANVSNNTVDVSNQSTNQHWSANPIKPEFFFGMVNNINPTLVYPVPYYLAERSQLQVQITNVDALNLTQFLVFNCLKCEPV